MSAKLFEEGGPHHIREMGGGRYEMRIAMPGDKDGMVGRECRSPGCAPAYFKVKPGTGIVQGQVSAFCPYCRHMAEPGEFLTEEQLKYMKGIAFQETHRGISRMIKDALGLGSSGRKTYGGGLISMEVSYKPGSTPYVRPPIEEELRRDIKCSHCGLEHAVFGLANWCPDCGADTFLLHVDKEFDVIKVMLSDVERRRVSFGARVAAHDIENALEDTVSVFEASIRTMIRRYLKGVGSSDEEVEDFIGKKVGNRLQTPALAETVIQEHFHFQLFADMSTGDRETFVQVFQKRHPITHNLGIVDRKYVLRSSTDEQEGRDVRVSLAEVLKAIELSKGTVSRLHAGLNLVTGR